MEKDPFVVTSKDVKIIKIILSTSCEPYTLKYFSEKCMSINNVLTIYRLIAINLGYLDIFKITRNSTLEIP